MPPHLRSATQPSFPLVPLKSQKQDRNCYHCTGGPAPGIRAQPSIPSCLSSGILDDAVRAVCRTSRVCGIDGIPWGQAGAGLPDEMQLDQHGSPQAGSKYQACLHHHPLVCAVSTSQTLISARPAPPHRSALLCESQLDFPGAKWTGEQFVANALPALWRWAGL